MIFGLQFSFKEFAILVPRAYDLFCQRWDRRALVSAITGCRIKHRHQEVITKVDETVTCKFIYGQAEVL